MKYFLFSPLFRFRWLLVATLCTSFGMVCKGQTTQNQPLVLQNYTRQQCIAHALTQAPALANAKIDEQIAHAKVQETKAIALPQLNAQLNFTDNLSLQQSFFRRNIIDNAAPANQQQAAALQLQYGVTAHAAFSQLLFSGAYLQGLKVAKVYTELAQKNVKQVETETAYQVSRAYYAVLVNTERLRLLDEHLAHLNELVLQSRAMFQNGTIEKLDLSRLEVSLNNLQTEREKLANLLVLSKALLKFQMGLNPEDDITLSEKIESKLLEINTLNLNTTSFDHANRNDFATLQTQKKINSLEIQTIKAQYYPSVYLVANGGVNNGSLSFGSLWNTGFYGFFNYGLRVEIPLFDGFQKSYQIQQKKLAATKTDNNLLQLQRLITWQQQQTNLLLKNGLATLQIQQKNLDLAKEVLQITQVKYKEGIATNLEVVHAENAYTESQGNYYTALYEVLLAKIDHEKAWGQL